MFSIENDALKKIISHATEKHDFDHNRADFLDCASTFLLQHQNIIQALHQEGATGTETVGRLTRLTDVLISILYDFSIVDLSNSEPCALVAIGGYGRAEMNPRSDIDLMFFLNDPNSPFILKLSERILYLLWDLGLDVGHSVRNESSCFDIAANDLSACTSLLDSRYVCGDQVLYNDYSQRIVPSIVKNNSRHFLRDKMEEHNNRIKKYGSSVYILEPNIKEGEGGLRDLHTTLWISKVKYKVESLRGLVIKGIITELEESEFLSSLDYLWRIRNELHYLSPRKNEQLHFEQQEKIAQFLGYKDTKKSLAVEQFMKDYYEAATHVEHLTSTLITRAINRDNNDNGLVGYLRRRNVADGFFALRGELHLVNDNLFAESPEMMMKAFQLIQQQRIDLSLKIKTEIRNNLHRINDRFRRSRFVNDTFLEILRYKKGVYDTLSSMHHLLFLNHYMPEFKRIYCQVQHDAYHIYTVDTHTLFAVKEIDRLWQGKYSEKKSLLTRLSNEIVKPELLILSVLLHDIGKGEGHNHCEKGAAMIPTISRRMGLGKEDSARLEFLVLHHLQMAHTSQRRDLNDPHLISHFSKDMASSENLNMLYLLTFCDIKAVGPDVWSEWKGFLLQDLYEKSYTVLEKGNFDADKSSDKIRRRKRKVTSFLSDDYSAKEIRECLRNFSTRYLMSYRSSEIADHMKVILNRKESPLAMRVNHNHEKCFTEVILSTVDIPALFTKIAGVMAANKVNILGAQIFTQKNGIAMDVLQVGVDGNIYDDKRKWKTIERHLHAVLEGREYVENLVCKSESSLLDLSHNVPTSSPRVDIDNEVSNEYTVVDITTKDKVGLLYQMTNSFKNFGLYIGVSKITTKGDRAGDTFYVQDIFGHKLVDQDKCEELKRILLDDLSE